MFNLLLPGLAACTVTQPLSDQQPGAKPALHTDEAGLFLEMEQIEDAFATSALRLKDPELEGYVKDVVCRISASYCDDLKVFILQKPYFNATMWPNGMMAVWSGLLLRADNEAQLAFVLGHEIGHYIRRHSLRRMMEIRQQGNLLVFVNVALAGAGLGSATYLTSAFVQANIMSFTRDQEREADAIGVRTATEAGYDPREGATLWRLVASENLALGTEKFSLFVATHPGTDERIANIEAGAANSGAVDGELERGRERYQAAIGQYRADWLRAELRKREFEGSQVVLDNLLAEEPNSAELHYYHGELYRLGEKEGYREKAMASYQRAIQLGQAPPEVHRELGLLLWDEGRTAEAKKAFESYLNADPGADDKQMIESYILELNGQVSS